MFVLYYFLIEMCELKYKRAIMLKLDVFMDSKNQKREFGNVEMN